MATADIRSLLDLGCGTGRHAVYFAGQGFAVMGVDRSQAMLDRAASRIRDVALAVKVEFVRGDIRTFVSGREFDAVLMNFNVLGYMFRGDDVAAALATARRNVRTGGIFIAAIFGMDPPSLIDPPGRTHA